MNKVILAGRLVKDPEAKYTQNGTVYTRFTLAVNRRFSKEPAADFLPIITWNKVAEICGNNLVKGSQVLVEGRIQLNVYEKDGKKQYAIEIIGDNVEFLGSKPKSTPATPQQAAFGAEIPPDEEIPF